MPEVEEKKLVFTKGEFDIICHDDGLVEISSGNKLVQFDDLAFEDIINRRRMMMHGN